MFLLFTNILSTEYKDRKEGQKAAVQPAMTKEDICMNYECLYMNCQNVMYLMLAE